MTRRSDIGKRINTPTLLAPRTKARLLAEARRLDISLAALIRRLCEKYEKTLPPIDDSDDRQLEFTNDL